MIMLAMQNVTYVMQREHPLPTNTMMTVIQHVMYVVKPEQLTAINNKKGRHVSPFFLFEDINSHNLF